MKNVLFIMVMLFICTITNAQEKKSVIIKAGTIVPLEAINNVRASEVHEGQYIDFKVTRNITVEDQTVIPIGTIAKGIVYEAKRSSWWGTKGRLGIRLKSMIIPSGDELFFTSSEIYIEGQNRTPIAVVTALFVWPCMFICGSKAEMKAGYEIDAIIANTTTIEID